ncbi:MAG: ATP-binding protein, partial [Candidatus Thorarchaeota archaeon]
RAGLEETEKKLSGFVDDPVAAVDKLEKQLEAADEAATKALEEEKVEEGKLQTLAAQGLYSALAAAEEEVEALRTEIDREKLRVSAIRLMHDILAQCRAEALAAVAGPVEAAATRTLRRIAGERLGALKLGDSFEPAHVVPETAKSPVWLDSVSGGEGEQIYLATRLALAEVLAREERQLLVLDDVLAFTDAGRLARVMTVLEEAAQKLQVLILTCHPERYRGLGQASFADLQVILDRG